MTDTNESNPAAGSEASTESTAPAEESKPEAGASEDLEGRIIEALRTCYDPEIPVNINELGLIYDIDINPEGAVDIKMTLTSPALPGGGHSSSRGREQGSQSRRRHLGQGRSRLGATLEPRQDDRGGAASARDVLESVGGNEPFQFLEPVEDDMDLRRSGGLIGSNHYESAIRRDIVIRAGISCRIHT